MFPVDNTDSNQTVIGKNVFVLGRAGDSVPNGLVPPSASLSVTGNGGGGGGEVGEGDGVGDGDGDGDGDGLKLGDGDGDALGLGEIDGDALGLGLTDGEGDALALGVGVMLKIREPSAPTRTHLCAHVRSELDSVPFSAA